MTAIYIHIKYQVMREFESAPETQVITENKVEIF